MLGWNQHRPRAGLLGDGEIALGEAEQIVGARHGAPSQFVGLGRIDADIEASRLQFPHRGLELGEGRIGQAAEIDHVGPRGAQGVGASENRLDAQLRSIDDLGEDLERMAGQIETCAGLAEKRGQILQFIGAALEGPLKRLRQARKVSAAAARNNDAVGIDRAGHPAHKNGFGHQRRDLHPHVEDRPVERRGLHALEDLLEAALGKAAGQEQNPLPHAATLLRRSAIASRSSPIELTVVTPTKPPRRSRFSRSIARG